MDDLKTSSKQWKWKAGSGTRLPPDVGVSAGGFDDAASVGSIDSVDSIHSYASFESFTSLGRQPLSHHASERASRIAPCDYGARRDLARATDEHLFGRGPPGARARAAAEREPGPDRYVVTAAAERRLSTAPRQAARAVIAPAPGSTLSEKHQALLAAKRARLARVDAIGPGEYEPAGHPDPTHSRAGVGATAVPFGRQRKAEWSQRSARARPWAPAESNSSAAASKLATAATTALYHEHWAAERAEGGAEPPARAQPIDISPVNARCGHVDHARYKCEFGGDFRYESQHASPTGGRLMPQARVARARPLPPARTMTAKDAREHEDRWLHKIVRSTE